MRPARERSGYLRHFYIHGLPQTHLICSSDVVDEIWSAICYFAEVPDAGKDLLSSRGVPKDQVDDAFISLQSLLRQARAFYSSAREASWRSSPLIYYYSFLNLVKALICLKWPDRIRNRISHGLSHQLKDGALEMQTVSVVEGGVFPVLYELLTQRKIPGGTAFDVLSLLSYCTDVTAELETVKGTKIRTLHGKSRLQVTDDDAYATLAIARFGNFEDCEPAKECFYQTFEEVELHQDVKRFEFGLLAEESSEWRFFETRDVVKRPEKGLIPGPNVAKICYDALRPYLLEHRYHTEHCDFALSPPLVCPNPIAFNEILGIYATIYFLSSLVRYYPRYFEAALVSKDVWMIDVFIRSAPTTLLRYLANRIFLHNRQFSER
jgi:hypothetical protein